MVMVKRRILLVDDSEILRMTTAALLEEAGYQVVEAASLAQARASLGVEELAAAVVDLHLADGLGTALLPELRAAHPRAAFILLSGSARSMDAVECDLYVVKGAKPEDMVERIGEAIERRST
jgi:two-component system response regulator RegA